MTAVRRVGRIASVLLASGLLWRAPAQAQWELKPWLPFVGCWSEGQATRASTLLCIVPVARDPLAADLVTLAGGHESGRTRVKADGTRSPVRFDDCEGAETARFSDGGLRVYLRSAHRCGDAAVTATSAIFSIAEGPALLYAVGVDDPSRPSVRLRTLFPVEEALVPRGIRPLLEPAGSQKFNLHREAHALRPLKLEDVQDVAATVNAAVAETWLAATIAHSAEGFRISIAQRDELEDGGMPARVVSLLHALSFPLSYDVTFSDRGARIEALDNAVAAWEFSRAVGRLADAGLAQLVPGAPRPGIAADSTTCGFIILRLPGWPVPETSLPLFVPSAPTALGAEVSCAQRRFFAATEALPTLYAAAPGVIGHRRPVELLATPEGGRRLRTGWSPLPGGSRPPTMSTPREQPQVRTTPKPSPPAAPAPRPSAPPPSRGTGRP